MQLVDPISGAKQNVTGDNWFSSLPLANKLLGEKKQTYVGTLRKNKREISMEFLPSKQREEKSSLFRFREDTTLVPYCPKKKKTVLVLSTMHYDNTIDEEK